MWYKQGNVHERTGTRDMRRYSLVLPIIMLSILLGGCRNGTGSGVVAAEDADIAADRVLYDTRYNTTVDGVRRAVQLSDSMYMYEDSATAQLFGVRLMMYDTLGNRTADLRSERGTANQRTQKMLARGNVVLVLADGRRIESEELSYDPELHRVWSDVFTRMTWPDGGVTTFETFTGDDEFKNPSGTGLKGKVPGLTL
jgi:LPS export ABC transporter protein LptC